MQTKHGQVVSLVAELCDDRLSKSAFVLAGAVLPNCRLLPPDIPVASFCLSVTSFWTSPPAAFLLRFLCGGSPESPALESATKKSVKGLEDFSAPRSRELETDDDGDPYADSDWLALALRFPLLSDEPCVVAVDPVLGSDCTSQELCDGGRTKSSLKSSRDALSPSASEEERESSSVRLLSRSVSGSKGPDSSSDSDSVAISCVHSSLTPGAADGRD